MGLDLYLCKLTKITINEVQTKITINEVQNGI